MAGDGWRWLRGTMGGTFGWDIWVGHLGGSFGWDIWVGHFGGNIGTNMKFLDLKQIWFVRYVIVRILPPFGSYAPVSPSLVPVNRLSYYLTFQSIFSLFFCILRFDHEVEPIGRPKRVFPARGGFLGSGEVSPISLSLSL